MWIKTGTLGAMAAVVSSSLLIHSVNAVDHEFYGFIKVDASYDTEATNHGDRAFFLTSPKKKNGEEFNITANQTRLGVKLDAGLVEGWDVSGKVEADFYEGGAEAKPRLRLRYAFVDVERDNLHIRAGQAPDLISPLVTPTINFSVGYYLGNTGFRRPQIIIKQDLESVQWGLAISRSLASVNDEAKNDDGEDSGIPAVQASAHFTSDFFKTGVWAYYGEEKHDDQDDNCEAWVVGADFKMSVNESLTVMAEAYVGANANTVLGGIGNGVTKDPGGHQSVGAIGGWAAINYKADMFDSNLIVGIDTVDKDDLGATGRTQNMHVAANTWYSLASNFKLGGEIQYLSTEYKGSEDVDGMRFQAALLFKF